jgi:hypothetical protein
MRRRQFLRSALAATGVPLSAQQTAKIEEGDPRNPKLCHRLDAASVGDDDLRFLEQIGLKWVRLEFGVGEIALETLRAQQRRFAQFGMRIYSGVHYAYRSRRVQLGEPGRDQDIETYCRFLRDLGMLEIPGDESAAAGEPDHVPHLAGDSGLLRAGTAYGIASMRAMLRRANEEVG